MRYIIALALFVGCTDRADDSGSDPDTDSDTDTDTFDVVATIVPADGTVEVEPGAAIVCTANVGLDAGSTLQVTDASGTSFAGTTVIVEGTLTWTPDTPLPLWAELTAECDAKAGAGSATATSAFTTRDGVWSAGVRVTDVGTRAIEPLAVRLDDGTDVVAWNGGGIFAMTRDADGWTEPTEINGVEINRQRLQLASAGQTAIAAWLSFRDGAWEPVVAVYDGAWNPVERVDPAGGTQDVQVAVSSSGVLTVAWVGWFGEPTTTELRVTQYSRGVWTPPVLVQSSEGRLSLSPQVVAEAGAAATLCWPDRAIQNSPVECAQVDDGAVGAMHTIPGADGAFRGVSLDYREDTAEIAAAWTRSNAEIGASTLFVATRASDGSWSAPVEFVPQTGGPDGGGAAVALGSDGNQVAVWQRSGSTAETAEVWASHKAAAGPWVAPERLDPATWTSTSTATVVLDEQGHAMAAWMATSEGVSRLYSARYRTDTGWSAPQGIVTEGARQLNPSLTIDGSGRISLFYQDNPDRDGVFEARFE